MSDKGKTVREKGTAKQGAAPSLRMLVLEALLRIMERGEYCDKVLHQILEQQESMERRDRAFVTRLTEGTLERCIEMDYVIERFSSIPVRKMKPAIRNILRMSVYQIIYMDNVPDSAACNEGVKLTVQRGMTALRGFVNGILRNVARGRDSVPYPPRKAGLVRHLSIWYSMPEWIVSRFLESYGETETEKILQSFLKEDKTTSVRCNLAAVSVETVRESLQRQGVTVSSGILFDDVLHIRSYGRLTDLEAFRKGWIQVQDESTLLPGYLAPVREDSVILDVCAAPGGKSLHLADRMIQAARAMGREEPSGRITACDISKEKVALIRQNLIRTGIHNVKLKKADALTLHEEWEQSADIVIADLPCSGLGVIGRKCDIKYKTKPEDIAVLAEKQRQILNVVSRYVKPGGLLIYSTCTMTREENEDNAGWIQQHLPFEAVPLEEKLPEKLRGYTGEQGYIQLLPTMAGSDGFFTSVFRRSE